MTKSIEDELTAVERRALKKRVRTELISAVNRELSSVVTITARRILREEIKEASTDKIFLGKVRTIVRDSIKKRADRAGAALVITDFDYMD